MAEPLQKVTGAIEKFDPIAGAVKRSGASFLSDSIEDTADFAKADRDRIEQQRSTFQAKRRQSKAENFKPKAPGSVAKSSESLLTRKV